LALEVEQGWDQLSPLQGSQPGQQLRDVNARQERCSRNAAFGSCVFLHHLQPAKKLSLQACWKTYRYHGGISVINGNQLKLNPVKLKIGILI